jgi:small subunit ribosomal protein S18
MAKPTSTSKKKGPGKPGKPGLDKKLKKKTSILTSENITWVDYKDVNLLRRFMSERAKVRARRVTGNDQQQQAAVARAIKVAREMALLPYSVRQVQQRSKGKGRDRGAPAERELAAEELDLTEFEGATAEDIEEFSGEAELDTEGDE